MDDNPTVEALVQAARDGDAEAWNQIVERYAPLVWGICMRYGLSRQDTDDVGQSVWLSLFVHLATIREPAALPGWLARTTGNECLQVLRTAGRQARTAHSMLPDPGVDGGYDIVEDELERAQLHLALRQAFSQLRPQCKALLVMLFRQAHPPYLQIAAELDMKIGSIGPTRQRCLAELRRSPALAALLGARQREGERGDADAHRLVE